MVLADNTTVALISSIGVIVAAATTGYYAQKSSRESKIINRKIGEPSLLDHEKDSLDAKLNVIITRMGSLESYLKAYISEHNRRHEDGR